ncbi:MAG: ABC transporter ATP-binding protein [Spirochaetes bacterium]|nr:ABC transporter ATP-binding protein [Spirochaetota bacterium]MBU0956563.1 ABC transporter ATP-binding protein [Spirochaetota bacterium]
MSVEVENLKFYYRTRKGSVKALDDVSFSIADGEILGIAGESGCGKSTLSNGLIHVCPPMELAGGSVRLDGKNLPLDKPDEMNTYRFRNLSIIPQYALNAMNPTVKIGRYVQDLMQSRGIDYSAIEKLFADRLRFVRLPEGIQKRYPIELSGGMKQRVVMVISTLLNPSLLLCDEITSALDVSTQKVVSALVAAFRDEKIVKSVSFVTHDVPVLYQIADRILIMYAGQVAEAGPTEEIIHAAKHPYTQALVAAMPEMASTYRQKKHASIPGKPPALLDPPEGCRFKERCPYRMPCCDERPQKRLVGNGHEVYCWKEDL